MRSRLQKAIDYIRGYCDKHWDCDDCKLKDKSNGFCILANSSPYNWDFVLKRMNDEEENKGV